MFCPNLFGISDVDFGDGNDFSNDSLNVNGSVLAFIEHDYNNGGDYEVNVSSSSRGDIDDWEIISTKFGLRATSLDVLSRNVSNTTYEVIASNDINDTVENVKYLCSENLEGKKGDISALSDLNWNLTHNYTNPGEKSFICSITSDDGADAIRKEFTIRSLEIEDYDILSREVGLYVFNFNVKNYYHDLWTRIDIGFIGSSSSFGEYALIPYDESVMSFIEVNYTKDGPQSFVIDLSNGSIITSYTDYFNIQGAVIENYFRTSDSVTNVYAFDVLNQWYAGQVDWSVTNPSINNNTNLGYNKSVMVFIEEDYSSEGLQVTNVSATRLSYKDNVSDQYEIRPIEIGSLEVTDVTGYIATLNVFIVNNDDSTQYFNLNITGGLVNQSESELFTVSDNTTIPVSITVPSSGVYRVWANINTSGYTDNQSTEVIA